MAWHGKSKFCFMEIKLDTHTQPLVKVNAVTALANNFDALCALAFFMRFACLSSFPSIKCRHLNNQPTLDKLDLN